MTIYLTIYPASNVVSRELQSAKTLSNSAFLTNDEPSDEEIVAKDGIVIAQIKKWKS